MNASLSILQKIKTQFAASVPNASAFHIAFAPFAFTLSSDDFYFLKGGATTGADARRYLREQSEFAILANSLPSKPGVWRVDGDNLLYNVYQDILNTGRTIDADSRTADEQARIDKAAAVLFKASGGDSTKYQAYKKYPPLVTELERKLIDHEAKRSAIAAADTAALAKWNLDLKTLNDARQELLIEWQTKGFRTAVESAKAAYDEVIFSKTAFVAKWQEAKNIKLGTANRLTDEYGVDFLATTCIPNSIADATAPIWKKISLTAADIAALTQSFTAEAAAGAGAALLAEFGDLQPDISAINFEYCLLDVLRPWFDESVINNHLWTQADGARAVSAGDDTLVGRLPAYPVKIILAKNIDLVFAPSSPRNDDIKNQLRAGSRLFLGPLLLKTIPTNLTDDKVTGLRVQQLTTPELAVLTRVAAQAAPAQPAVNTNNRVQMMQFLNRRPQPELRRAVVGTMPRAVPAAAAAAPMLAAAAPAAAVAPAAPQAAVMGHVGAAPMLMTTTAFAPRPALMATAPMATTRPMVGTLGTVGTIRPGIFVPMQPGVVNPPPPSPPPQPPQPPQPAATLTVAGRAVSADNQPLAACEIQLTNTANAATQSVLSLDDGSYTMAGITPGKYQFKARKTGYVAVDRTVDLNGNSQQDVLLERQAVPVESFQVIGMVCRKLPRLPDPMAGAAFV